MQFAIIAALFGLVSTVFATDDSKPPLQADAYCDPNGYKGIVNPSAGDVIVLGKPTYFHYCSYAYFKTRSLNLKLKVVAADEPDKIVYQVDRFNTSVAFTTGYATQLVISDAQPGKYQIVTDEDATGYTTPSEHYSFKVNVTIAEPSLAQAAALQSAQDATAQSATGLL